MSIESIGELIHERRTALGMTLEDVGNAVGVTKSTVRKWEKGMIKNMGRDKLAALARVLNLNPALLVLPDKSDKGNDPDLDRLEALHQDPRLGLLFDRSRKMSSADVEFMIQMADRILKERDGE